MEKPERLLLTEGIESINRGVSFLSTIKKAEIQEDLSRVKTRLSFFIKVGINTEPLKGMVEFIDSEDEKSAISLGLEKDYLALLHGVTLIKSGVCLIEYLIDEIENDGWAYDSFRMLNDSIDAFIQLSFTNEFETLPKTFSQNFEEILKWAS